MSGTFEPELGQAIFGGSPWFEQEMQPMVEAGLTALGYQLIPFLHEEGEAWEPGNPAGNNGGEFVNDVFEFRAYCWCDNTRPGHEDGCPPNFVCGDFQARWYKHVCRGNTQSRPLTYEAWTGILNRCIASLEAATP